MQAKGFVIFAEGEEYIRQAYLACLSIVASKNRYPVSLITSDTVSEKYRDIFDNIIDIPWYKSSETDLCAENRWKIYHASPYYETIVLDSDVLVLQDLEQFWNFANNYDLYYPTNVFTYRKEKITSDYYRKAFTANNLPNLYNAVHYFKKTDWTKHFFEWVETVTHNWELFYGHFCPLKYPKSPSMDITTAIVSKILHCDTKITNQLQEFPQLVHMKAKCQNWKTTKSKWQDRIGAYLTEDLELKIGNHRQDTIFHYTEKDFVTDEMIGKYEKCLNR